MVNNSININKANSKFTPQIVKNKKTTTYGVRNPDPGLEQTHKNGINETNVASLDTVDFRRINYIFRCIMLKPLEA
jgi:hypothetical protein